MPGARGEGAHCALYTEMPEGAGGISPSRNNHGKHMRVVSATPNLVCKHWGICVEFFVRPKNTIFVAPLLVVIASRLILHHSPCIKTHFSCCEGVFSL